MDQGARTCYPMVNDSCTCRYISILEENFHFKTKNKSGVGDVCGRLHRLTLPTGAKSKNDDQESVVDGNNRTQYAGDYQTNLFLQSNVHITPNRSNYLVPKFSLVFVNSQADHAENRKVIRDTFGNQMIRDQLNITVVFLLAKQNNSAYDQASIETEAAQFGDILQGDFEENYFLMARKVLMGFRWLLRDVGEDFCEFVIKTDDDMYINMFRLLDEIHTMKHKSQKMDRKFWEKTILCAVLENAPVPRKKENKWYVSVEHWPETVWPSFCPGSMYIVPLTLTREIYSTAFQTSHFVWHEDVFLTGIIGRELNVTFINLRHSYIDVENTALPNEQGVAFSENLLFAHIKSPMIRKLFWNLAMDIAAKSATTKGS